MKRIESLRRGLQVMQLLRDEAPLSLAALARRSGLAKATLLRILVTLEDSGHARRGLGDGLWHAAGPVAEETDPDRRLTQVCGPLLDQLCQKVLWPSDVGVYHGGSIRVLETSRRVSPFLVNRVVNYGIHVLPSAMGRAVLAWASDADRAQILADLRNSAEPHDRLAAHPDKVEELIGDTRARGYAVRHPGYFVTVPREALVSAIAVPVMVQQRAIAALNLSWVASAQSEADFATAHLERLQQVAADIARAYA